MVRVKRSKFLIIVNVLRIIIDNPNYKTSILARKSNLGYYTVEHYISILVSLGFVDTSLNCKHVVSRATESGIEFCKRCEEFIKSLPEGVPI